jgi:hypothetical protein
VELAKEKADIEPEAEVHLVLFPKPRTFFERLLSMDLESRSDTYIEGIPEVYRDAYNELVRWERLIQGNGFFVLMPYDLRIE